MTELSEARRPASSAASTFELEHERHVAALGIDYQLYRHPRTGARHIHLAAEDDNNAFMVAFPTIPEDSTGVAHILEHTTLCGSRRYPVRDPFFMMLRRSLNTFMNAFTSNDMTAYPFATCNRKDFDNLLQVYLDAVFFPRLDELDFAQEGHRVEFADPDDPESPLTFKGVVYNEMKGAMSAPVAQLWHHLQANLFPTTTYHYNSGGDPAVIPDLTYDGLRRFHARHYHPSQAVFMTYGDLPVADHQARFEALALNEFEAQDGPADIPDEQRFDAPRAVSEHYAIDPEEDPAGRTHVCWGWVLGHTADTREFLEAHLLNTVLLDHSGSPLRRFLEQTPLADAPSELCGLDDSARQTMFFAGVEGSEAEHAEALQSGLDALLAELVRDGVPQADLETALDRLEMAQRDVVGDGFPYGLQLLGRTLAPAMYGADPVTSLDLDGALADLRERVRDPAFFPALVRERLADNPHRVRVTMAPDGGAAARAAAAEQARLQAIERMLDPAERAAIVKRAEALRARQQAADDPSVLPGLSLADVPARVRVITPETPEAPLPVAFFPRGTNGITHQRLVFTLPDLTGREMHLLAVHTDLVADVGVGDEDYLTVSRERARHGEFFADVALRETVDGRVLRGLYTYGAKGLARHEAAAARQLYAFAGHARFDEAARVRELLAQVKADAESEVTDRGHALAVAAAVAALTPAGRVHERLNGITNVRRLKTLASATDAQIAALGAALGALHAKLLSGPCEVVLAAEEDGREALLEVHRALTPALAADAGAAVAASADGGTPPAAVWKIPARVNFCARAWPAVPESHPDAPALAVLGGLIQNGFLHTALREQGGAYGSGAQYDPGTATFRFFSYRDPRLAGTLEDFDRALDFAASARDPQLLTEAVLGVIRAMDQPRSPAGDAFEAYFNDRFGRTGAFRQQYRERVLAVAYADIKRVLDTYFGADRGRIGVLVGDGAEGDLERLGLSAHSIKGDLAGVLPDDA